MAVECSPFGIRLNRAMGHNAAGKAAGSRRSARKKPAAVARQKPTAAARKEPAVVTRKKPAVLDDSVKRFTTPITHCACGGSLIKHPEVDAVLYGFDGVTKIKHCMRRCCKKDCRSIHGYNFSWSSGKKVNTVDVTTVEVLFANDKIAFDMVYIKYHESLQFRGALSSRAIEWSGKDVLFPRDIRSSFRYRQAYQDVRFMYLAAKEFGQIPVHGPDIVSKLELGKTVTEKHVELYSDFLHKDIYPPDDPSKVKEMVMDGHEKVLQRICKGDPLPMKRSGAPRKSGKNKPFNNGWFMLVEPRGNILSLEQQFEPENVNNAINVVERVIDTYKEANALYYDRMCRIATILEKRAKFKQFKYKSVDKFHGWRQQEV